MNRKPDLFKLDPWLENRLGQTIFDEVPATPGIYRFYDRNDNLLYTGKAKNLRQRLFSYKRIRPGDSTRKVRKMLSLVHSFQTEFCTSEEEALLLENRWIREMRPEFNHVNKSTETYYFIKVWVDGNFVHFELAMNNAKKRTVVRKNPLFAIKSPLPNPIEPDIFGAFKGHLPVRKAFGYCLQLLWIAENNIHSPCCLPRILTRNLAPRHIKIELKDQQSYKADLIKKWFSGESEELLSLLTEGAESFRNTSRFNEQLVASAINTLTRFYDYSLRPNFIIRSCWLDGAPQIPQNELDDWMVKVKNMKS